MVIAHRATEPIVVYFKESMTGTLDVRSNNGFRVEALRPLYILRIIDLKFIRSGIYLLQSINRGQIFLFVSAYLDAPMAGTSLCFRHDD